MCTDNKHPDKKNKKTGLDSDEMPSQSAGESNVPYLDKPRSSKDKKIHPRQKIPPVPKGKEVPDKDSSPPLELED